MNQKAPDTTGAAPDSTQPGPNRGSGVHVDVENLYLNAQFVIRELLTNWPEEKAPYPWALNLYVTADQTELWKTWAESRFPDIRINVLGTQRFSMAPTKNSADITLVLNAAMDILTGKADHIVLVSNDSDYIALHTAIRDWHQETHPGSEVTPFLWVMTDEEKRISRTIQQFFPSEQLHTVPIPSGLRNNDNDNYPHPLPFSDTQPGPERRNQRPHPQATPSPEAEKGKEDGEFQQKQEPGTGHPARNGAGSNAAGNNGASSNGHQDRVTNEEHTKLRDYQKITRNRNDVHRMVTGENWEQIAETIMEKIPIGGFSARDTRQIIRKHWPDHQLGYANPSQLGNEFSERIWPILERYGVTKKKGHKSGQYEMTNKAKKKGHELKRDRELNEADYLIPITVSPDMKIPG